MSMECDHHASGKATMGEAADTARRDSAQASTPLHFGWGRHLPMIRQNEAAECGLACLAMIAGYYGHHVDLPTLRRRFALSLKGITLTHLVEMAGALGLACRPLRLDMDELSRLATPCIMHWDMDHFVVLRKVRKQHVVIHDPAAGERHLRLDDLRLH